LADITHGFVGADLHALAKESAMSVLRRLLPDFKLRENDYFQELPEILNNALRKCKTEAKD